MKKDQSRSAYPYTFKKLGQERPSYTLMKLGQTKPALHVRNRVTEDWPYTYRDRVDQHAQAKDAQHAQSSHGRPAIPGLPSFKNGLECDYPRSTTERSEGVC